MEIALHRGIDSMDIRDYCVIVIAGFIVAVVVLLVTNNHHLPDWFVATIIVTWIGCGCLIIRNNVK